MRGRRWLAGSRPGATLLRVALLVAVSAAVFTWVLLPVRGAGISMQPAIRDGQLIFVNRLTFRRRQPKRSDVVAVRLAGASVVHVKRVIGLPGERVRIEEGVVTIDEIPLAEPYLVESRAPWTMAPVDVPAGHYFVIGDNRSMAMADHQLGIVDGVRLLGTVWGR